MRTSGQTGRQADVTMLIIDFRHFANAPTKLYAILPVSFKTYPIHSHILRIHTSENASVIKANHFEIKIFIT